MNFLYKMGDKIPIMSEKKYTFEGLFDIKETYNYLKEYLEDSRYYEISEKDYEEKNDGKSRKIVSKNEAEQIYNDKFKVILKYEIAMNGKEIEVKVNDKKTIILCKGNASLAINAYIEPDWDAEKPESAFIEFLKNIYNKLYNKDELDLCKESVAKDVQELINRFKQQMNSAIK